MVFFRAFLKTIKFLFVVFLFFAAYAAVRPVALPKFAVKYLCDRYAPLNYVAKCENMSYSLLHGLVVDDVKFFDSTRKELLMPIYSMRKLSYNPVTRHINVYNPKFLRLSDSYYSTLCVEKDNDVKLDLPRIKKHKFEIIEPEILGLTPSRVTGELEIAGSNVELSNVAIAWKHNGENIVLSGGVGIDAKTNFLEGRVKGLSKVEYIRPFLVAIDVPVAVEYMDMFSDTPESVPVSCYWQVNLKNADMKIVIDIDSKLGTYRGVPIDKANGRIQIEGWTRGTNFNFRTQIGPLTATDPKGRTLEGSLVFSGSRYDPTRINVKAKSNFKLEDIINFTEVLADGTLDCISCFSSPELEFAGVVATSSSDQSANEAYGKCSIGDVVFFGMPFRTASFDLAYVGSNLIFSNIVAKTSSDALVNAQALISMPGLSYDTASFSVEGTLNNGSLEEMMKIADFQSEDRYRGTIKGKFHIESSMNSNLVSRLNGHGSFSISDGHLNQFRIFAGLTDLLAEKIPGVASIVNQSGGSADFEIKNGVVSMNNILIEGSLFSIRGKGKVDLQSQEVDFRFHVQFFKKESILSSLVNPVTWAFTKLFMEVKLEGSLSDPK
jgi:hypothetical protein